MSDTSLVQGEGGPYTSGPCNELGHPTAAHPAQSPTKPGRQDPSGPTHPPATTPPPSITASTPCNAQYKALIQAIPLHCMPSPMQTPGGVHAPKSTLKCHRGPDRTDTVGVKKEKRGPTAQSQPPGSPHASLAPMPQFHLTCTLSSQPTRPAPRGGHSPHRPRGPTHGPPEQQKPLGGFFTFRKPS